MIGGAGAGLGACLGVGVSIGPGRLAIGLSGFCFSPSHAVVVRVTAATIAKIAHLLLMMSSSRRSLCGGWSDGGTVRGTAGRVATVLAGRAPAGVATGRGTCGGVRPADLEGPPVNTRE